MGLEYAVGLLVGIVTLAYLVVAMVKPEKF